MYVFVCVCVCVRARAYRIFLNTEEPCEMCRLIRIVVVANEGNCDSCCRSGHSFAGVCHRMCVCVCVCVCMYIYLCVCLFIYIYIYIHTHSVTDIRKAVS